MSLIRRGSAIAIAALCVGCSEPMSMFSNASEPAARVRNIAWFMIILAAIVYVIVIGAMIVAARRNREGDPLAVDLSRPGVKWVVIGGIIMPALILAAVFVVGETALGAYPHERPVVTISVIGHQWWWEAEYQFAQGPAQFRTANEIHIPVGKPVRLLLTSADVIHSFWVPRLQGKLDLIPGDTNDLRLMARTPGIYRGQCAEFCGDQHAHMAFNVIAEDSATFQRWLGGQLANGAAPTDSMTHVGQVLFVGGPCAMCHTVRGTSALGQVGPDLTHVASRLTIGAGTLPNTLGNLQGWIANAQSIKPGAKMPTITQYNGQQLRALASYVASLK
jgi:cytochrome c oxidase subunit II